jgi:hypothetical protein
MSGVFVAGGFRGVMAVQYTSANRVLSAQSALQRSDVFRNYFCF